MSAAGRETVEQCSEDDAPRPLESPSYLDELYRPGEAAQDASDEFFRQAGEANENGDDHELAATILTAVLFFAGIAAVVDDRRIGWALIWAAGVIGLTALGFIAWEVWA